MYYSLHYGHHRAIGILAQARAGLLESGIRVGSIDTKSPNLSTRQLLSHDFIDLYNRKLIRTENSTVGFQGAATRRAWYDFRRAKKIVDNFDITKVFHGNKESDQYGVVLIELQGTSNKTLLNDMKDLDEYSTTVEQFIQDFVLENKTK